MRICTKIDQNRVILPLKVNWSGKDSDLNYSTTQPEHDCFIFWGMGYFFLNDDLRNWFIDYENCYQIEWDHVERQWFLEIFDPTVAVLFKLTFDC